MANYILRLRGHSKESSEAVAANSQFQLRVLRTKPQLRARAAKIHAFKSSDKVIRWGCRAPILGGPTEFNKVPALALVNDKTRFRKQLLEDPETSELVPKTWFTASNDIKFPVIVRPRHHEQGLNFWPCYDRGQLQDAIRQVGPGFYISELVDKAAEYRVFVVQNRVIAVVSKAPVEGQVCWNVAQGGHFDNVRWKEWPMKAIRASLKVFEKSGLDFGVVDVIVDKTQSKEYPKGRPYVIEINSSPMLTSPYRQQAFALAFDWLLAGKEMPAPEERFKGWASVIHPVLRDAALAKEKANNA